MRFTTNIIAAAGLFSLASAHIVMTIPKPFDAASLDNAPLNADGSNFPCKKGPNGVYDFSDPTPMPLGSSQLVQFKGDATHGGGSCQISITYDSNPTPNSVWKVLHSFEGGCPMADIAGNRGDNAENIIPDVFTFQVPTNLPTGNAVLAWTWYNRIGNREMYMNCAPVNIGGGNAKRTAEQTFESAIVSKLAARQGTFLDSLPDMFVANIGNGCGTLENFDLIFPDAGQAVEHRGSFPQGNPVGSCGKKVPGVAPIKSTPPPAENNAPLPGGVFVEVPKSSPVAEPSPVVEAPAPSPPPAAPAPSQPETPAQQPGTAPEPIKAPVAPSTPAAPGSAFAAGTPCPADEGQWNCIGGTSFQRCASGQWSVVQSVAAGTVCNSGISSSITISARTAAKREVRFSNAHVRRHAMRRSF